MIDQFTASGDRAAVEEPSPCVSCGLPLPIRICPDDPSAVSFECVFCHGRYRGVLLPEANAELRRNVRRAE